MKKILSILMIMALVGGVAFAQDAPAMPAPVVRGSATMSWGMDLGYGKKDNPKAKISSGFLNEASASVSLPLVKGSFSKGEGDVYAFINLDGVSLGLAADLSEAKPTGKVGDLEAKIVFYGAYITVYNAPEMKTAYVSSLSSFLGDVFDNTWGLFASGFGGYGTKVGYANADLMDIDVGLKFVSNGSWEDRDGDLGAKYIRTVTVNANRANGTGAIWVDAGHELRETVSGPTVATGPGWKRIPSGTYLLYRSAYARENENGRYGIGLDFHMVPVEKYLTVDANFNMTFDTAKYYQTDVEASYEDARVMNAGAKITSSPIEGLNIALGFDGGSGYEVTDSSGTKTSVFAWALGFGVDYTHDKIGTVDFGLYTASKGTPYGDASVLNAVTGETGQTDIALTFGYEGMPLVDGLDIHTRLNVFQLLSKISEADKKDGIKIPLGVNFGAGYRRQLTDSMWIKPYADFWGESNARAYFDDTAMADQTSYFGIAYAAGVAFGPMERLTIDVKWSHGKAFAPSVLLGSGLTFGAGQWRSAPVQHKADNGRLVVSAKITY